MTNSRNATVRGMFARVLEKFSNRMEAVDRHVPSFIHHLVLIVGGIIIFVPAMLPNVFHISENVHISIGNSSAAPTLLSYSTSIVNLALVTPLAIDWLMDILEFVSHIFFPFKDSELTNHSDSFLTLTEMFLVMVGLMVSPVLTIAGYSANNGFPAVFVTDDSLMILVSICGLVCRTVFVVGTISAALSRMDATFWPKWIANLLLLLFVTSQILETFYVRSLLLGDPGAATDTISTLSTISGIIVVIGFYIICLLWLYYRILKPYFRKRRVEVEYKNTAVGHRHHHRRMSMSPSVHHHHPVRQSNSTGIQPRSGNQLIKSGGNVFMREVESDNKYSTNNTSLDQYQQLYVSLMVGCITIIAVAWFTYHGVLNHDSVALSLVDGVYILIELLLIVLTMRRRKFQVTSGVVSHNPYTLTYLLTYLLL